MRRNTSSPVPCSSCAGRRSSSPAPAAWRTRASPCPMPVDTRFDTASLGKLFTAAAAFRLVDRGLLGLDEPVRAIADLAGTAVPGEVTLRHCLTHCSGISDDADEEAGRGLRGALADDARLRDPGDPGLPAAVRAQGPAVPGGDAVQVQQLRVRPRRPGPRSAVGDAVPGAGPARGTGPRRPGRHRVLRQGTRSRPGSPRATPRPGMPKDGRRASGRTSSPSRPSARPMPAS